MDLAELLTVETSVLRTLCLTVNSESSELKTRITENLIVDDFYFPITKSIFGAISAYDNREGAEPTLDRCARWIFFRGSVPGEAPSPQTLTGWIEQPEERQR